MAPARLPRAWRGLGAVAAVAGAALFTASIRAAGPHAVLGGISRLGSGFIVIFLLGGLRHLLRAVAWTLCVEPPEHLPLARAFSAFVAGDSVGNVTPFGLLASEPSKIMLVKSRVAPNASIAALTVETLFYGATVAVMLVAGTAALLLSFRVPTAVRIASFATLGGAVAISLAGTWVIMTRRRIASGLLQRLARRPMLNRHVEPRLAHAREIEERIFGFVGRRRERVLPILGLEVAFHASAVFEIWFALSLVAGTAPTLLTAFVLEYVNRTITSVFQFVPLWLGVDEAGTGLVTAVLRLGPAAGVSLALIRKGRLMAWTAVGLALLLHQGVAARREAVGG